jgi:hypothetical protein
MSIFDNRLRARCRTAASIVLLSAALVTGHDVVRGQAPTTRPTLYQRLGGYDGIASYVALVFPERTASSASSSSSST